MTRIAWLVTALAWGLPALANAETTTTMYFYNPDGALTRIVESSDGSSKTTYFTWDDFDAASGKGTAANGNLVGIGTMEGDDSIQSLEYDNLDRLVRVTNTHDATAAMYEYHPDELLAASLNAKAPSSDGLQHYYNESRYPQVTNLFDRHTGELSSRHRRIRYLEDGTEQMLVRHRKDVDGVYNLVNQTMSGYAYDPYGASLEQELTGSPPAGPLYSVRNNPYRYSNELRDPVAGADYLRARWYLPGHQTFLQRDPVPNLNRYGYANGNPVTNYDPSGRSAKGFVKGLEQGFVSILVHPLQDVESQLGGGVFTKGFWTNPSQSVSMMLSLIVTPLAGYLLQPAIGGLVVLGVFGVNVGATPIVQYGLTPRSQRRRMSLDVMYGQSVGSAISGTAISVAFFGGAVDSIRAAARSGPGVVARLEAELASLKQGITAFGVRDYQKASTWVTATESELRQRALDDLVYQADRLSKRASAVSFGGSARRLFRDASFTDDEVNALTERARSVQISAFGLKVSLEHDSRVESAANRSKSVISVRRDRLSRSVGQARPNQDGTVDYTRMIVDRAKNTDASGARKIPVLKPGLDTIHESAFSDDDED